MPLGCSHAQSRDKLILIPSTSKTNISGHPTRASGIEFHYKGPDISYFLNTEEEQRRIQTVATVAAATVRLSSQNLKIAQIGKGSIMVKNLDSLAIFTHTYS